MQYLPPPHIVLRKGLVAGETYPLLAEHMSSFLAETLFKTSALCLSAPEYRAEVAKYSQNSEMCALTEQVVFSDPYGEAEYNRLRELGCIKIRCFASTFQHTEMK